MEDGPIRVHFHSLYGLGENVSMNGCICTGTKHKRVRFRLFWLACFHVTLKFW